MGTTPLASLTKRTDDGFFRLIDGQREASHLLGEPRVHAALADFLRPFLTDPTARRAIEESLLNLNGPEHRRQRGLIAKEFTPRAAERVRPISHDTAHHLLDELINRAECDVVGEFSWPYVTAGICDFVGFDIEDVDAVSASIHQIATASESLGTRGPEFEAGLIRLLDFSTTALAARRDRPRNDFLSTLAQLVADGSLTEMSAVSLSTGLLSAGHEPTSKQLSNSIEVLVGYPDLWEAMGAGEVAAKPVVEELLRVRSANRGVHRRIAEDFEWRGAQFTQGEWLRVDIDAANHDPTRFDDPSEVNLETNPAAHVSFGRGAHICLGAAVARVQLQEALTAVTQRLEVPEILEFVPGTGEGLVGPRLLRISVRSRRPA